MVAEEAETALNYYAHSKEGRPGAEWQILKEHLAAVAKMAEGFASVFGLVVLIQKGAQEIKRTISEKFIMKVIVIAFFFAEKGRDQDISFIHGRVEIFQDFM